jgi:hypothetical protein
MESHQQQQRYHIPISLNKKSRNVLYNKNFGSNTTNRVLITQSTSALDIRKTVKNLKIQRKKEMQTFHTDTLKANFKSTFRDHSSFSQSQINHEGDICNANITHRSNLSLVYKQGMSPRIDQSWNRNFFYKGLSAVVTNGEKPSEFLHKTQNLRRMRYAIDIQKEQIKRNEEEPLNKIEEIVDKITELRDNQHLLEDKFLPTFEKYLKALDKQTDHEKYILGKIQSEHNSITNVVSKLEYDIKTKRDRLHMMREYKMFLHCLKERKSLNSLKATETLTRKSSFHHVVPPLDLSPKRSIKASHLFRPSMFDFVVSATYSHEDPMEFDADVLINQFNILEKDIIDKMKKYDYNQTILNQNKKEMVAMLNLCEDENEENQKIREFYFLTKQRNENLKKELEKYEGITHRISNSSQIKNIYTLISRELPELITKRIEDDTKYQFKKNLDILSLVEKAIGFLMAKYITYKEEANLKSKLYELEKNNDKTRRTRQFLKKKEELEKLDEKRIEKEQRKYLKMSINSNVRKSAPRFRPSSNRIKIKNTTTLNYNDEFKSFIMF